MESQNSSASTSSSEIKEVNIDLDTEPPVILPISNVPSPTGDSIACQGGKCVLSYTKNLHERRASMIKLTIAIILCIIFMIGEVICGVIANSLAILTDAAHLLSDVAGYMISLFALWATGWEPTTRHSYGFSRIEILGALVSVLLIWLVTGILIYEAIDRFFHGSGQVKGLFMFVVSAFGLVVNIFIAVMLGHDHGHHGHGGHSHEHGHGHSDENGHEQGHGHEQAYGQEHEHGQKNEHEHGQKNEHEHGQKNEHEHGHEHDHDQEHEHGHVHDANTMSTNFHHNHHHEKDVKELLSKKGNKKSKMNINVESAYLHVLGDIILNIGGMIGGGLIWYKPEWKKIDLACTLIFSVIVLLTTIKIMRSILGVLMESTPRDINTTQLENGLCAMDGVVELHDLHIWTITMEKVVLTCHVTIAPDADSDSIQDQVMEYIKREFSISHVTIQIEKMKC
ncbi:metal tolerance protein 1-like protein [Carex littledalei]|uniref:Metal tolerance protein 1-like protein n=1 Tax=Carex littledalei TaxID=544730 RepID=A0A833VHR1_9POAL|nr:metal tolerance protein 1-like protein [Carex littledalei]